MASSPRLWFLLAAGRPEFQLFLERSFQKELAGSGPLTNASGQDQTSAIARRQAATTMRRSLPTCFQIGIDPVLPDDAWDFSHLGPPEGPGGGSRSLKDLLDVVQLPVTEHGLSVLCNLFDVRPRLDEVVQAELDEARRGKSPAQENSPAHEQQSPPGTRPELTYAAKMALTLSARTLRDLQRDLSSMLEKKSKDAAVESAVRMLKNAIDESSLPSWASEQLHNRIIRRDAQDNWILDLSGRPIRRLKRTTLSRVVEWPHWQNPEHWGSAVLVSELHLRRLHDMILELHDLSGKHGSVHLPANVAGWFMIAHDLLTLYPEKRVLSLGMTAWEMAPELMLTLHELSIGDSGITHLKLCWSLPTWDTFLDFQVFNSQWKALLWRLDCCAKPFMEWPEKKDEKEIRAGPLCRLLLAAWVDNVCSVAGPKRGLWSWKESGLTEVLPRAGGDPLTEASLQRYEQRVRESVARLVQTIAGESSGFDRLWTARVWLEQSLPLLVMPEHAPHPELTRLLDWDEARQSRQNGSELREAWAALERSWASHKRRLIERRHALVAEALGMAWERKARQGVAAAERAVGLAELEKEWFEAVDRDASARKTETLKALDGRRSAEAPGRT